MIEYVLDFFLHNLISLQYQLWLMEQLQGQLMHQQNPGENQACEWVGKHVTDVYSFV